jgi:hypothetical protein
MEAVEVSEETQIERATGAERADRLRRMGGWPPRV